MTAKDVNNTGVQTDEKKQHFDDIYVCETPGPHKVRILDALDYVSDDFNKAMFEEHIRPTLAENNNGKVITVHLGLRRNFLREDSNKITNQSLLR